MPGARTICAILHSLLNWPMSVVSGITLTAHCRFDYARPETMTELLSGIMRRGTGDHWRVYSCPCGDYFVSGGHQMGDVAYTCISRWWRDIVCNNVGWNMWNLESNWGTDGLGCASHGETPTFSVCSIYFTVKFIYCETHQNIRDYLTASMRSSLIGLCYD